MIGKFQFISQENKSCTHLQGIEAALKSGIQWVQLRIKDRPADVIKEQAMEARVLCEKYGGKLIINDHPAIALEVGAEGVHIGKEDMPVEEVRRLAGEKIIIGATANSFDDIRMHVKNGADYIGLGPFRFTSTKEKLSPVLGLTGYYSIMAACDREGITIPVLAIGGIEPDDVDMLLETGVYGIAASSMVLKHKNGLEEVLKKLN